MKVILFDIDGTLVRSGGAGKAAIEAGLQSAFGVKTIRDDVPYSGRTDHAIGRDLLVVHDIEPSEENQRILHEAYLERLPGALAIFKGSICPGVLDLLEWLAPRDRVLLGLLTGNVRAGARIKLNHYGMWDYFRCGGFGDFTFDRDDVARAAFQDVQAHLGKDVDPASIWIIGDTPLDVKCARAIGANAIAVATGVHSIDELAGSKPDSLLADLTHAAELRAIWA